MTVARVEQAALLRRHRPQLRYDSQEPYRAIACESIVDNPGNLLVRDDGGVLARAAREGEAGLSLGMLARYPGGLEPRAGDRLDEASDVLADAQRMQPQERYRNRAYGRVVRTQKRTWLQYWLWLYYNPKHLAGLGRHEGDWELVQVGLDAGGEPEVLTYAQHGGGERKPFEAAEHHRDGDGVHPVVYVAPFSHAAYFEPGTHFHLGGTDNPDGAIVEPLPALEPFEAWARWPGSWGSSRGVLWGWSPIDLGGRSPRSPGRQRQRWSRPDQFHAEARERPPRTRRAAWRLGRRTYPRLRRLEASVEGREALVDYELDPLRATGPMRLYLTVHDRAEPGERTLLSAAVPVERSRGRERLVLPALAERPLVRGSAFNALRQRSDVLEAIPVAG